MRRRRCLTVVTLSTALVVGSAAGALAAPTAPKAYTAAIEAYAAYSPQATCDPVAKPGVVAWRDQLLRTYSWTRSLGIVRACNVGGRSEHKEGRAFDWGVNASSSRDVAAVNDLFTWLFATDRYGNKHAMARRLGIQYVIWNRKIWGSYSASQGWRTYTGASPHTDHVHFSFSWPGARKTTSYWTGKVGSTVAPPTGGGGTDGTRPPMPDDELVSEPLPPARLLQAAALPASEVVYLDSRRSAGVTSRYALQAGQPYLVHVSGTYRYRSTGARADAECSNTATSPGTWVAQRSTDRRAPDADHLDVYLNGIDGRFTGDTGERCDPKRHTYRWTFVPSRTGRANFKIWDQRYTDNAGRLTVRLYKLSTDDSDKSFGVAAVTPTGATPKVRYRAGVPYVVQVVGTYKFTATATGDAQCALGANGWTRRLSTGARFTGVLVNADDLWGRELVDTGGGCDARTHTYRFGWTPRDDTTITVKTAAPGSYTNNTGTLKVRVVRADLASRLPGPPAPPPETLMVDSRDRDGVLTARSYESGRTYEVVVRGVYDAGEGVTADAECTATERDATWRTRRESTLSRRLLWDLMLNGDTRDWQPLAGGDGCSAAHEYRTRFTAQRDGRLWFGVRDVTHYDNEGSLTVTVRQV